MNDLSTAHKNQPCCSSPPPLFRIVICVSPKQSFSLIHIRPSQATRSLFAVPKYPCFFTRSFFNFFPFPATPPQPAFKISNPSIPPASLIASRQSLFSQAA